MTGRKRAVILSVAAAVLLVAVLAGLLVAGSLWGIPPFGGLMEKRLSRLAGNGEEYAAEHVLPLDGSPCPSTSTAAGSASEGLPGRSSPASRQPSRK